MKLENEPILVSRLIMETDRGAKTDNSGAGQKGSPTQARGCARSAAANGERIHGDVPAPIISAAGRWCLYLFV